SARQGVETLSITASNVTIADLTILHAGDHLIHVQPGASAGVTGTLIYNVVLGDPGEQAVKVNANSGATLFVDQGTIACSHVYMSDTGRSYVEQNSTALSGIACYTCGIDIHAGQGWNVRDNTVEGFWCNNGLAEPAIHFWDGSRDNVVQRNKVKNN